MKSYRQKDMHTKLHNKEIKTCKMQLAASQKSEEQELWFLDLFLKTIFKKSAQLDYYLGFRMSNPSEK